MESVYLPMSWFTSGYDLSDSDAAKILENDHEWGVIGYNHYCPTCAYELSDEE